MERDSCALAFPRGAGRLVGGDRLVRWSDFDGLPLRGAKFHKNGIEREGDFYFAAGVAFRSDDFALETIFGAADEWMRTLMGGL